MALAFLVRKSKKNKVNKRRKRKEKKVSQAWWHMPVSPALGGRSRNSGKFQVSLVHIIPRQPELPRW